MKTLTKNCIVCGKKYIKPYNTGIPEWKRRKYCSHSCISKGRKPWNRGISTPEETRRKQSIAHIGIVTWNKGKKGCYSNETILKIKKSRAKQVITSESRRKAMLTRKKRYGYINSPITREKLRKAFTGSKSHFWKGGISKDNYRLRRTARYKKWRKSVFKRDDYVCQRCGVRGGELHPHHIKSWEEYPKSRFTISNGQTLCIACHRQTATYARNLKSVATT